MKPVACYSFHDSSYLFCDINRDTAVHFYGLLPQIIAVVRFPLYVCIFKILLCRDCPCGYPRIIVDVINIVIPGITQIYVKMIPRNSKYAHDPRWYVNISFYITSLGKKVKQVRALNGTVAWAIDENDDLIFTKSQFASTSTEDFGLEKVRNIVISEDRSTVFVLTKDHKLYRY